MTDTTNWTPEARTIREAERAACLRLVREHFLLPCPPTTGPAEYLVDRLYPAPPPEYSYGTEIVGPGLDGISLATIRRRSDGRWERHSLDCRWDEYYYFTDDFVRACAAEVPFTDREISLLMSRMASHRTRHVLKGILQGNIK